MDLHAFGDGKIFAARRTQALNDQSNGGKHGCSKCKSKTTGAKAYTHNWLSTLDMVG